MIIFVDLLSQVGTGSVENQLPLSSHVLVESVVESLYPVSQKYNNWPLSSLFRMEKPPWSISAGNGQVLAVG